MKAAPYLPRALLAGLWLGSVELALVLATERDLFLSSTELWRYARFALTALPLFCVVVYWVASFTLRGAQNPRRIFFLVAALAAPCLSWTLWSLTSGRRVRDLPGKPLIVAMLALALTYGLARAAAWLWQARDSQARARRFALLLLVAASVSVALDTYALRRLYPALHYALAALSLASALVGCALLPLRLSRVPKRAWLSASLLLVLASLAVMSARSVLAAPNARYVVSQTVPLSGKLLRLLRMAQGNAASTVQATRPERRPPTATRKQAGIDLRGRDVLLISVDALRADRLRAYGGKGLTPALDELAKQAAVFKRAYTPTPHTSYAVASLMTAKFMRPLLALGDTKNHHPTLAEILRRHRYRTAAFYPPAIFFVDEERFKSFAEYTLGFEYVKVMFSSAKERVAQLATYLKGVDAGHPLFVWVHLFEPHEPYDPPPEFAKGDTPLERYDGEVAAADAGVGTLVSVFRSARPMATVILTADHGEEFGEHGGHHHGTTLFDEQIRVPLLWSSPGHTRGQVIGAPVEIIDIGTTLLSALGIPREAGMHGDDLGALLAGATAALPALYAFSAVDDARMVTDGRMKLICADAECQLFDLEQDPRERVDRIEQDLATFQSLRAQLMEFTSVEGVPSLDEITSDRP